MSVCQRPGHERDMSETELMVRDCKLLSHKLSEWEFTFIDSLNYHPNDLTSMQLAKLEEIWDRIT